MAGTNETDIQEDGNLFQWDQQSQLYYHASSGFYHDPAMGWYYSSKDGLYYKFENGDYVLWETDQTDQSDANQHGVTVGDNSVHEDSYISNKDTDDAGFKEGEYEGYLAEEVTPNQRTEVSNDLPENLRPPSEWLEDTLIELYLSGSSNRATDSATDTRMLDGGNSLNIAVDGVENDDADELEEGEWIPDSPREIVCGSGAVSDEGSFDASREEEIWRAQYGQVIQSDKELVPDFPVVDLWEWAMVKGTKKGGKGRICRLVGRLVRRSAKLHPSMPSSSCLLKTAPICEVHLDLVRVRSGQVYKLRNPKVAYLASLTSYDSSNPTKDWGFPELSMDKQIQTLSKSRIVEPEWEGAKVGSEKELSAVEKGHAYRDRAAERRSLHGGFGVGPGQKKLTVGDSAPSSPVSASPEEAAAESLNNSFGAGSYARRILESMGWKEGEALGNSMKGLTEPLEAVGNKGSSGLGWDQKRNWKHH